MLSVASHMKHAAVAGGDDRAEEPFPAPDVGSDHDQTGAKQSEQAGSAVTRRRRGQFSLSPCRKMRSAIGRHGGEDSDYQRQSGHGGPEKIAARTSPAKEPAARIVSCSPQSKDSTTPLERDHSS